MQRWMQAALERARRNGVTRSGSNRAMGTPIEDVKVGPDKQDNRGFKDISDPGPIDLMRTQSGGLMVLKVSPKTRQRRAIVVAVKAPADRPVSWGKGRAARRQQA